MPPLQPRNLTVLVIEDDIDISDFLELFLGASGYTVYIANTGEQGLVLAARTPVDAVLLDRRLPDMDGVDVCEQLRARNGAELPVIMMTADYDAALETAARAAGTTSFIRKPFAPPALLERLADVLGS